MLSRPGKPKYLVEFSFVDYYYQRRGFYRLAWPGKLGKPTDERARKYREDFNRSLQPGGANAHLRDEMSDIGTVTVRLNDGNPYSEVIAQFEPPVFEVVN